MRLRTLAGVALVAAVAAQPVGGQPNCVKGKPCGNACIAAAKTCRIAAAPRPAPPAVVQPQQSQARRDSLLHRRDRLLEEFAFVEDRVDGGGLYYHRMLASWPEEHLFAVIDQTGAIRLQSRYVGDSWLHHERVSVRIGNRVLRSAVIPTTSARNVREVNGGTVSETLRFTEAEDGGILQAIAAAPDSVPIFVKMEGRQGFSDFELAGYRRRALLEVVELARLIRTVGLTAKASAEGVRWIGYRPLRERYRVEGVCQIPSDTRADWQEFASRAEAEASRFTVADEYACARAMTRPKAP